MVLFDLSIKLSFLWQAKGLNELNSFNSKSYNVAEETGRERRGLECELLVALFF